MQITKLSLYNFRNFTEVQEISIPSDSLLVAAAPNTIGKTNFLEALAMLVRGKSWRASQKECVKWGADSFIVRGEIKRGVGLASVAVRYHSPTKKLRFEEDGVPISPVTFYAQYPFVLFVAEDTFIFSRSPAGRRNLMNAALVSHPTYVSALVQYQRTLKQRNASLRSAGSANDILMWTELLAEHAAVIWKYRQQLADFINTHLSANYALISGDDQKLTATLERGVEDDTAYTDILTKSFSLEQRYGYTLYGPHRDDLLVMTSGKSLPSAFSQGQMRGVIIALKFCLHRYLTNITGEYPLLLLDEVLSELDQGRQEKLLNNLPAGQVLLTCTEVPEVLRGREKVHLLHLESIIANSMPEKAKVS